MTNYLDYSTLNISKIIVHDIPKHKKDDLSQEPDYSEQESPLTLSLKLFFKEKVTQSLSSSKSFHINFDSTTTSPAPSRLKEIIDETDHDLVSHSKVIARHLFQIQKGNNAAGILVCILGTINTMNTCILMKLERDKGAQLKMDHTTNSFSIEEVQNLMLTQKTKIFKVALFVDREISKYSFDGVIMDYQIDIKRKKEVTTWFLSEFLGCKAFENPKIITQKFYNYTKAFIDTVEGKIERAKYIMDLNSYLQMNTQIINPREFADNYLTSPQHKNDYKNYLDSKNFDFGAFPKDLTQIERQIKKITMVFENEITIIGTKGAFDDRVILSKLENGKHKAEIISRIRSIK